MKRVVILISGRGSNMAAILDAVSAGIIAARVAGVISSRPDAAGLKIAATHGVAIAVVDHQTFPDRNTFEGALAAAIDALEPDLVVLAGFMRILSAAFVDRYAGRLINIHPSLLPSYPGLGTHRRTTRRYQNPRLHRAFRHGDVDHGPIIARPRCRCTTATATRPSPRACSRSSIGSW
jgi:phosphoribosylglycinamide formyltransferase-1